MSAFRYAVGVLLALLLAVFLVPMAHAARSADTWECTGAVSDCRSPKHEGTYGCTAISAPGIGDSEKEARKEGREQCAVDLEALHGGSFTCRDGSALVCKKAAPPQWVCRGPVPGCSRSDGQTASCSSATGVGSQESYARDDARDNCEQQLHDAHGGRWSCSDVSQLTCSRTN